MKQLKYGEPCMASDSKDPSSEPVERVFITQIGFQYLTTGHGKTIAHFEDDALTCTSWDTCTPLSDDSLKVRYDWGKVQ